MNWLQDKTGIQLRGLALAFIVVIFVIISGISFPAQGQTVPVAFPAPTTFSLDSTFGNAPLAVAVGDFNRDGKLDVAALVEAGCAGNDLDVTRGNGDGTFQTPIATLFGPDCVYGGYALAAGDFNGDGLLDIAIWGLNNQNGLSQIEIFLGNGAGAFTYSNTYTAANSNSFNPGSSSIVAADVNGDGKADLVALTPYNGVFVFLGNGDGTFQTATNYPLTVTAAPAFAVAVADLNGDGKLDIAVYVDAGIGVLLNTGSGKFGPTSYYATSGFFAQGSGIAVGDLNKDGKPDIIIPGAIAASGVVAVFLNQGNGTFAFKSFVDVGEPTYQVALADINGDKKLDIIATDNYGEVWTFYGKGNGTFTDGPAYPLQGSMVPTGMIVADFNGDGALDLLEQNSTKPLGLVVLGRNDGSFQTSQFYVHANASSGHNIVTADFNGDGIPDVAYSWATSGSTNPIDFAVLLGSANGTFAKTTYVTAGTCNANYVEWIAAGDVTGDGKADIVAALQDETTAGCQNHTIAVLTGKGTGKFGKPVFYSTGSTAQEYEVFLADVNGDGKLDIVTSNADGTISVLLNKGKGTFSPGTLITSVGALNPAHNALAIADFNGDGKADIAVTTYGNQGDVYVLPGKGDGTFGTPIQTGTAYLTVTGAAADFNKDGKMDLLITTYEGGCGTSFSRGYAYLKGNGDGTFAPGPENCTVGGSPEYPVVADLNGDGKLDVVIPYGTSVASGCCDYGPTILQGNGDGTFVSAGGPYYVGAVSAQAVVADFNGDGMLDIAVLDNDNLGQGNNSFLNFLTVMLNSSEPVSVSPLTVNYGSLAVGAKKAQTVILTNNQDKSLAISGIMLGGIDASDFSEKSTCGSSRKAGWNCTITVTFTPTVTGTRTATLSIKDAVGTQTVQLNGLGK